MDFLTGIFNWFIATDFHSIMGFMSDAWQSDFVRMTSAFTVASIIHQKGTKKYVNAATETISATINNLTRTVSKDLAAHADILSRLQGEVGELKTKVSILETLKKGEQDGK